MEKSDKGAAAGIFAVIRDEDGNEKIVDFKNIVAGKREKEKEGDEQ